MELSDSKVLTLPGGFKLAVESDHGPPGFQGSKYPTPYIFIYIIFISGWFKKSPQTSWAIFILRWEDQLAVLSAKANMMFMRAVQQNVFLILNRVPVTYVTDPELIRPSIPVMTHFLDQNNLARRRRQESARLRFLEASKRR